MKKHEVLRDAWIWNGTVEAFVRDQIEGYSLNVCAGASPLGDVKVDLDPRDRSIIRADMIDLPFANETFDTVIEDPVWKIGFFHRFKPFYECVRVCKVGDKIIYNAYWVPDSKAVVLDGLWIRQDKPWTNTRIISVFRKKTNSFDGYKINTAHLEEMEIS